MRAEAKKAFVLADWMKAAAGCQSESEFSSLLDSQRERLQKLQEVELDKIIQDGDIHRQNRFQTLSWSLEPIILGDCFVYHHMGGRPWAAGTVRQVSVNFERMESADSRVWTMKRFASIFRARLPLIVIRQNDRFDIDDGSHRAIAMYHSGIREVKAYVGRKV